MKVEEEEEGRERGNLVTLLFLECKSRLLLRPTGGGLLHTDEGHRSAKKLCVLTCAKKID